MIIIIDFDFKCQLHQLQAQIVQVRLHQQVTKSLTLPIEGTSSGYKSLLKADYFHLVDLSE